MDVVSVAVRGLLAPNPGPMTLAGTNTWLLGDPTRGPVVVVDPGPDDVTHLAAIRAATPYGVSVILLTHRHHDHADLAPALAEATGASVRAADPALVRGGPLLADGDVLHVDDLEIGVRLTPGHTADSVSLVVRGADAPTYLLTGDTVLGRGTTVITRPDGDLRAYLASLDLLSTLVAEHGVRAILPGHGPRVTDPFGVLEAYRVHRHERLDQVRAALEAGDTTVAEVVARVYADVDSSVLGAAEQSVAAQLDYLHGSLPCSETRRSD